MNYQRVMYAEVIAILIAVLLISWAVTAYGESHHDNLMWKLQQKLDKINQVDLDRFASYEKQVEKVDRTQNYLKAWGWNFYNPFNYIYMR